MRGLDVWTWQIIIFYSVEVGHVAVADTLTISGLYKTLFKIHDAMRDLLLIVSRQALQQ